MDGSTSVLHTECERFVTLCTVVTLVVFELVFFFGYAAPIVERGNVEGSAEAVVSGFSVPLGAVTDCAHVDNLQQVLLKLGNTDATSKAAAAQRATNARITAQAGVVVALALVGLVVYWWTKPRREGMVFPWNGILTETLPVLALFALYDFVYFSLFVRTWTTTSAAEFALEFTEEASSAS